MPELSLVTGSPTVAVHSVPSPFVCSSRMGAFGAAWVRVAGGLDRATSPRLGQTVAEAQLSAHLVVLDLREVTFIDSSGVRAILDTASRARRQGGRLMLVRGPPEVDRELSLSGAFDHVLIFDLDPTEPARTLLAVG